MITETLHDLAYLMPQEYWLGFYGSNWVHVRNTFDCWGAWAICKRDAVNRSTDRVNLRSHHVASCISTGPVILLKLLNISPYYHVTAGTQGRSSV